MPADCDRLHVFNLADNLEVHTSVYNMMQRASTHPARILEVQRCRTTSSQGVRGFVNSWTR